MAKTFAHVRDLFIIDFVGALSLPLSLSLSLVTGNKFQGYHILYIIISFFRATPIRMNCVRHTVQYRS